MAQYKVPQDVEADDKLLGPFNFRQFVYLMIAGALIAVAVGLFQLFPLLAIIPLPPMLFFLMLALPLKRDQPMETYLAAIASYYMKPRTRTWQPGQRETTIKITAPKKREAARTRDITGEEATHRLSFLADIVDTEGYAIKGISNNTAMREEFVAETAGQKDMFESQRFSKFATAIQRDENERHSEVVEQMQGTIDAAGSEYWGNETYDNSYAANMTAPMVATTPTTSVAEPVMTGAMVTQAMEATVPNVTTTPETEEVIPSVAATDNSLTAENFAQTVNVVEAVSQETSVKPEEKKDAKISPVVVLPEVGGSEEQKKVVEKPVEKSEKRTGVHPVERKSEPKAETKPVNDSIIKLMDNNKDYSVKTLADQVKRIKGKEEGEIFISLH